MTAPVKKQRLSPARVRETIRISRRLFAIVWNSEKWLLLCSMFTTLIPSVVPFVNGYIYKLVIDTVIAGLAPGGTLDMNTLTFLFGLRIGTYFMQDAAFSTQSFVEMLLWTRMPIHFNSLVFTKIAQLDMQYFEDSDFRNALERVKSSLAMRPQNLISNMMFAMQSVLQFSIALVAIVTLNWWLILFVIVVAIPEFAYQLYESRAGWVIWAWNSPLKKRFSYLEWLLQHAASLKEIKLFGLAPLFIRETQDIQTQFYKHNAKLARKTYIFRLFFNVLSTCLFVGVEIYVIWLATQGRVTIGDIGFYTLVVTNFQNGLGGILRNANQVFEESLYVKSIFEVLDAPKILTVPAHPAPIEHSPPLIEFRDVHFTYPGMEKPTLSGLSLRIEPGEKIALVGENGSGKSTIVKLLARFYDVTGGQILIDGKDIRDIDLAAWHNQLGILFQDFNRYDDSVKQNIYYGNVLRDASPDIIEEAAMNAGAEPVIKKLPNTFEQMLGKTFEGGSELSTGQWQKIALARAYFRNAPILALDEPTAAIDARAEAEIFARVEELAKGKTVLLISHRFSTVRTADRIIVMHDGKILEEGSHEQLMETKGLYSDLFSLQAKGYM